ncbi:MAG: hypothetical protein DWQ10_05010 [Calditrichaeota bacterium]|nr:MAG: hypothetical protein DWQ10_05010 [Calditrichota bacterium]
MVKIQNEEIKMNSFIQQHGRFVIICLAAIVLYSGAVHAKEPVEKEGSEEKSIQIREMPQTLRMGQDKYQHLVLSSFLVAGQMFVYREHAGLEQKKALQVSVATTAVLGVCKEVYDYTSKKGHPSLRDILADIAGIGVGIFLFSIK